MHLLAVTFGLLIVALTTFCPYRHAARAAGPEPEPDKEAPSLMRVATTEPSLGPTIMRQHDVVLPRAPAFEASDYALTLGLGGAALAMELGITPPSEARWRGGVLMDDGVRDTFRLGSSEARATAGSVSDGLVLGLLSMPLVDAGFMAATGRGADAGRMLLIDLQSFSATASVLAVTRNVVGRERPYARACASDDPDADCGSADSRRSFVSGHTAMAFTAAGLVCTHHAELDIWGGGAADDLTCALATTAATAAGVLRIMADKHYATDVLGGAALGAFSGYLMPRILHYGFGGDDEPRVRLTPMVGIDFAGASAAGTF